MLEFEEKPLLPDGNEKSLKLFRNFSLFAFLYIFDGNYPLYTIKVSSQNQISNNALKTVFVFDITLFLNKSTFNIKKFKDSAK